MSVRYKNMMRMDSAVVLVLLITVISWRVWHQQRAELAPEPIGEPPSISQLKLLAAGDEAFLARLLILWLQQRDVQYGEYISFRDINYQHLIHWLETILMLEPTTQYPMLLATRVYSMVADKQRKRQMIDFVYQQFKKNPEQNWQWMAEIIVKVRHGLKDRDYALKLATTLAESPEQSIPQWARDMRLFILEDMGETEQVKLLVGGLMKNNRIKDPNELRFLEILLNRLQKNHN